MSTLADPVSKYRPGLRFRSTSALIARNNSGALWISSRATGPSKPLRNPPGSPVAAARTAVSSNVRYGAWWVWEVICWTSVLLPVCLAPCNRTTGLSDSASSNRDDICLGNIHSKIICRRMNINHHLDDLQIKSHLVAGTAARKRDWLRSRRRRCLSRFRVEPGLTTSPDNGDRHLRCAPEPVPVPSGMPDDRGGRRSVLQSRRDGPPGGHPGRALSLTPGEPAATFARVQ